MDTDLLRAKGAEPANIRVASVRDYALRIGQRATLVPSPGKRAFGILMDLMQDDIANLYSEASVRAYRPEAVLAHVADGSAIPALCFNLVEPPGAGEANGEYAAKLRALAEKLRLPSEYIESIH
jgi:hypothetical protein